MEKKEKKVYEQPRMEAVEVKIENLLKTGSEGDLSRTDSDSENNDVLGF